MKSTYILSLLLAAASAVKLQTAYECPPPTTVTRDDLGAIGTNFCSDAAGSVGGSFGAISTISSGVLATTG